MKASSESIDRNSVSFDSAASVGDMTGWRRWLAWAALAGLYMVAAGMSGAKALQSLGLLLLIGASLPFLPHMLCRFARDPLAIAVALFFVYLLISAANATWEPGSGIMHWDRVRKMSRVLLVPIVAYWLAGRRDRIERLFLFLLAGMLAVIVEQVIRWGDIAPLFSTNRISFRINPIWMGLNASIGILALIAWGREWRDRAALWLTRPGAILIWLVLLMLMLQVLIVSQSRGAYLAFCVGIIAVVSLKVIHEGGGRFFGTRRRLALTAAVVVFLVVLAASQFEILAQRFIQEQETIRRILAGEFKGLPTTPIGIRVYMYMAGLEGWLAKPWLGWGPDGAIPVIAHADVPETIRRFSHLHNGPLDVLVRFGLVGVVFFYAIPLILLRAGWRSLRDGSLSPACGQFLLAAMVTFTAADLTETYLNAGQGWHWLMLIGGAMYTARLWRVPPADDCGAEAAAADGRRPTSP